MSILDGRSVLRYLFKRAQLVEDAQAIRLQPKTGPFIWRKANVSLEKSIPDAQSLKFQREGEPSYASSHNGHLVMVFICWIGR